MDITTNAMGKYQIKLSIFVAKVLFLEESTAYGSNITFFYQTYYVADKLIFCLTIHIWSPLNSS